MQTYILSIGFFVCLFCFTSVHLLVLSCKKHLQLVTPSLKHTPWSHFRCALVKEDRGLGLHHTGMLLICARYLRWSASRHAWQNPISYPHPSVIDLLAVFLAIALWSFNNSPAKRGCWTFYKIWWFSLNPDPLFLLFFLNRCWHML